MLCGVILSLYLQTEKRNHQVASCGALPNLLLRHEAVVEVEPDDVVLLQFLDGAPAAGGLLQLGVQLLHQHPQLRWQPQHLHNPNPNHTPLHQNTYRRTGQGKHNNNFTVYSTICSKLTT